MPIVRSVILPPTFRDLVCLSGRERGARDQRHAADTVYRHTTPKRPTPSYLSTKRLPQRRHTDRAPNSLCVVVTTLCATNDDTQPRSLRRLFKRVADYHPARNCGAAVAGQARGRWSWTRARMLRGVIGSRVAPVVLSIGERAATRQATTPTATAKHWACATASRAAPLTHHWSRARLACTQT